MPYMFTWKWILITIIGLNFSSIHKYLPSLYNQLPNYQVKRGGILPSHSPGAYILRINTYPELNHPLTPVQISQGFFNPIKWMAKIVSIFSSNLLFVKRFIFHLSDFEYYWLIAQCEQYNVYKTYFVCLRTLLCLSATCHPKYRCQHII